jgi:type IV pilus assembly protein PilW
MTAMHIKNRIRKNGFSLVEVMVGMVMGMIVLLVIMQTFSVAEGYKRTTSNGSDAQVNGLLALRTLETEIRMAGYGMTGVGNLCPSITRYYNGVLSTGINMPVKIVDGGAEADTIEITYSAAASGGAPIRLTKTMTMNEPRIATSVNNAAGIAACDFILLAAKDGSKTCTMQQATGTATKSIQTDSGKSRYNPPVGTLPGFPKTTYNSDEDMVINMGSFVAQRFSAYRNGATSEYFLRQTNVNSADDGCAATAGPVPDLDLFSNIVYLKAQYGVASNSIAAIPRSERVDCWTGAATADAGCNISAGNWSAPPDDDVKHIKAIRVLVVARSQLPEKPSSGSTCDTTSAAPIAWTALGAETPPVINLTSVPNWKCYRYKTYQTIVPMTNVIWGNL